MHLTRQPGNVASAWVSGALLLAVMLRRDRMPGAYLAVAFLMRGLAGLWAGDPWPIVLAHATSAPIAVGLAWSGLRHTSARTS